MQLPGGPGASVLCAPTIEHVFYNVIILIVLGVAHLPALLTQCLGKVDLFALSGNVPTHWACYHWLYLKKIYDDIERSL